MLSPLTQPAASVLYAPVLIAVEPERSQQGDSMRVSMYKKSNPTGRERAGPRLCVSKRGAAADGLGDLRVPDGVQVGAVTVVGHVDAVAAYVEVLAVQRLADVADELGEVLVFTGGSLECRVDFRSWGQAYMDDHL